MTVHTPGAIALLGLALPNVVENLPHDAASLFVLVLTLGAIGAVVVPNLPGKGRRK